MKPISELDLIKIGEIIKAHGYKGELVVKLSTDFYKIIKTELLFFEIEGNIVPFYFEYEPKAYKRSGMLAKFENLDSEKEVESILNCSVYTRSDNIEEDEEELTDDLKGYKVFNENLYIGIAEEFMNIPSNPVLAVITESNKEILIPLNDKFIKEIDHQNSTIIFSLPDGLTDVNE